MKQIIQFKISKGDKQYIAECIDLSIITQGRTLDEVAINIKEAVDLHLEDENNEEYGLAKQPAVLVNFELGNTYG
ncbi:MAG: type II toxin-antitoxin system HicB family antitoxin [bacterium]|nr:type II toxin-antitoxin system HicB family antitoxin [bacterium]